VVSQQQPNPWLAEYMSKTKPMAPGEGPGGMPGTPSPMLGAPGAAPPGEGLPPAGPAELHPDPLAPAEFVQDAVPMEIHGDPGQPGPGQPHGRNVLPAGDSAEIRAQFQRTHGRQPTVVEQRMIMATPTLTRQLGRPPTRVEMLQYGLPRDVNVAGSTQFEVA
jgi:hypothetical protein